MGDGIPMDKIRNLSVRKTILLYMAAALLGSFILSAVIVRIAGQTQRQVWWKYVDEDAYFEAVEKEGPDYVADIPRPGVYEMTRYDYFVSELCDSLHGADPVHGGKLRGGVPLLPEQAENADGRTGAGFAEDCRKSPGLSYCL